MSKPFESLARAELRKTDSESSAFTERGRNIVTLAEKVMAWKLLGSPFPGPGFFTLEHGDLWDDRHPHGWNPYESIADAWMLIKELKSAKSSALHPNMRWARFILTLESQSLTAQFHPLAWLLAHDQPCEAICAAALAALEKGEQSMDRTPAEGSQTKPR